MMDVTADDNAQFPPPQLMHIHKLVRRLLAAALIGACAAVLGAREPPVARVLFIGNSLTYVNNLPRMVEDAAGKGRVVTQMVAFPDFGLEEHWQHGEALRAIRRGGWTHVVLQQGPTSLPESRRILIDYTLRFAPEIHAIGARVVLFGVWPGAQRRQAFDAVTASYAAAAEGADGDLVAVGEGWREAWKRDASLRLYGPDGFHPSPLGTYVGALMFARYLTGEPPAVAAIPAVTTDLLTLHTLHAAAARAIARGTAPKRAP
jgi:hypothetical protein